MPDSTQDISIMAIKPFLSADFLLETETAKTLYHDFAANMPIIDYHCHLPQELIAKDINFENITQVWLNGDHYKWRAMRANGINERYITGNATDAEKFEQWALTVPYTMRNPLYHWTHLELKNPFGIETILDGATSASVYEETSALLQSKAFSIKGLLTKANVKVICTTDDPADDLAYHQQIKAEGCPAQVLPTYRPDKAMSPEDSVAFNAYIDKLAGVAGQQITDLTSFLDVLNARHDYFHANGCRLSDHGLETVYAEDYTLADIKRIFSKVRDGYDLHLAEVLQFKSFMLVFFAEADHAKGWTQQFHLGALRNNNQRMLRTLGPDTGFDSIGDFAMARSLSKFLDRLDNNDKLAKTILYNLNPADNALFGTMIGNYNDGSVAGKIQYGSGWWF